MSLLGIAVGTIYFNLDCDYFIKGDLVIVTNHHPKSNNPLLESIYKRDCRYRNGKHLVSSVDNKSPGAFVDRERLEETMIQLINVFLYTTREMEDFQEFLKIRDIELHEENWQ